MRHHEHERRSADRPDERAPERPKPIHNVLALQRSVGNQAVAAMLAREPVAEEAKTGGEEEKAYGKATLAAIGAIPILSFTMGVSSPDSKTQQRDFQFTSRVGGHSDRLMGALVAGSVHDAEVDIGGGRMKLKMEKAMVSSYQISGDAGSKPLEYWTLVPGANRIDDGSGGGGGGGGSWDDGGGPRG